MGNKDILAVIDRAVKTVAHWPAWKRTIANKINYSLYKTKGSGSKQTK